MALLHASAHEAWARFCGGKRGKGYFYTGDDCLQTYPLLLSLGREFGYNPENELHRKLDHFGEDFHALRLSLMSQRECGITEISNCVNDPDDQSEGIMLLRQILKEIDYTLLEACGWPEIEGHYGFSIDWIDASQDLDGQSDDEEFLHLQGGFACNCEQALSIRRKLFSDGVVKKESQVRWVYGWRENIKDNIVSRLLALNAERYDEEVALGLHSKGGKKPAKDPSAGGKRVARPAKAADSVDTQQIGLAL